MITEINLNKEPKDGIYIIAEGVNIIVYFDLVSIGEDLYKGISVYSKRDYKSIVSDIITDKYDSDDTQAILANYVDVAVPDDKREEYIAEYNSYQEYRDKAKKIANIVISRLNGDN